jgi:hypothetical protein
MHLLDGDGWMDLNKSYGPETAGGEKSGATVLKI